MSVSVRNCWSVNFLRRWLTRQIDTWRAPFVFLPELPSMLNFPRHFSSSNYAWNMAHFSKYERKDKKSFQFLHLPIWKSAAVWNLYLHLQSFLPIEKLEFEWVINDFYSHTSFQMKWKTITLVFQKNNIEIGALNGWGFLLSTKKLGWPIFSKLGWSTL